MYEATITIKTKDGSAILVDKNIGIHNVENILDIDLSMVYAEAQQKEIELGLDVYTDDLY